MATSLTPVKRYAALFTTALVPSNAVAKSGPMTLPQAISATVYVNYSRVTSGSLAGATVFILEGNPSSAALAAGTNADWRPIYMWTTASHGVAASASALSATAAAGATALNLSNVPVAGLSNPVCIYNSGDVTKSEWNWLAGTLTLTSQALLNSLDGPQTLATATLLTQAEQWAVPVELTGICGIRLVVHNLWNAVASNVLVKADVLINDATAGT